MAEQPYRTNALWAAIAPKRMRWARVIGVLAGTVVAAGIIWALVPWTRHADLPIALEPPSPTAKIAAAWNGGWRSVAIGSGGAVFEHVERPGEPGVWHAVASPVREDLFALDGGDWPTRDRFERRGEGEARVFAAGAHGVLLDCSREECVAIQSGTDVALRVVKVGFGQAFVAGDHGTLLHVVPQLYGTDDAVDVEPVATGTTASLRAVSLACHGTLNDCLAIAVGDDGVIFEGTGTGFCPTVRTSGAPNGICSWFWKRTLSPTNAPLISIGDDSAGHFALSTTGLRLRRGEDGTWRVEATDATLPAIPLPVHVVESKLWRHRSRVEWASVELLPEPRAMLDGRWVHLEGDRRWVAAATRKGHAPLVLDGSGDLFSLAE